MEVNRNKKIKKIGLVSILLVLISCNRDEQIIKLLQSGEKEDIIKGSYMAGESKNKKFVPLLLKNADDKRTSINIRFKGYNIYQEKMIALKKIFDQDPPSTITSEPDSIVIKFYVALYQNK